MCGGYRGMKFMSHTMKLWKRIVDRHIRAETTVRVNQFGFCQDTPAWTLSLGQKGQIFWQLSARVCDMKSILLTHMQTHQVFTLLSQPHTYWYTWWACLNRHSCPGIQECMDMSLVCSKRLKLDRHANSGIPVHVWPTVVSHCNSIKSISVVILTLYSKLTKELPLLPSQLHVQN